MRPERGKVAWGAIGVVAGLVAALGLLTWRQHIPPNAIIIEPPDPRPTTAPTVPPTPQPLRLYITGEVLHPAVYELPAGSIARDLVEAAGGFTTAADPIAVNLALPLADGMQLHVPAAGESAAPPVVSGGQPSGGSGVSGAAAPVGPINLNSATAAELESLPGIGPVLAGQIVAYREANGPFAAVDDIVNVSGIGPATLEKIRALVTVE